MLLFNFRDECFYHGLVTELPFDLGLISLLLLSTPTHFQCSCSEVEKSTTLFPPTGFVHKFQRVNTVDQ